MLSTTIRYYPPEKTSAMDESNYISLYLQQTYRRAGETCTLEDLVKKELVHGSQLHLGFHSSIYATAVSSPLHSFQNPEISYKPFSTNDSNVIEKIEYLS